MKYRFKALAAGVATLALVAASVTPATSAALPTVTPKAGTIAIGKIGAKKVASKKSTAKLTPKVTAGKNTKITSKKITVKKGTKTVAHNASSYKAKPGTYKVTTTAKYKTLTKKKTLVTKGAGNTKKIKMNCTVVSTETIYGFTVDGFEEYPLDLEYFSIECTGSEFDGKYKANAAYVYYDDISDYLGLEMIWGDSFPSEPKFFPVKGKKFTVTAVPQNGKLYKTKNVWSAEKTMKKTETVKVTVKK